jgi:hypothetical protein
MNLGVKFMGGLFASFVFYNCFASNEVRIHDSHQLEIIPYQLVVDAGVSASEFSDDPDIQL